MGAPLTVQKYISHVLFHREQYGQEWMKDIFTVGLQILYLWVKNPKKDGDLFNDSLQKNDWVSDVSKNVIIFKCCGDFLCSLIH